MKHSRVPFLTIQTAIAGDVEAMSKIVNHYKRYIMKLSIMRYNDQYGNIYKNTDEDIRRQLEAKLIAGISKFKIL